MLLSIVAVVAFVACNSSKEEAPKCLVLYYSQTGITKQVAEELAQKISAVVEEIKLEEPYDGDYEQTIDRCKAEMQDSIIPKIKPLEVNLDDYDVIFIGYPVWFGTYASPIAGLIQEYGSQLAGKKIVPFCTFGSGGLESSIASLKEALADSEITDGFGIRAERIEVMPIELERFLIEGNYAEGEIEPLPEFSEAQPVAQEDVEVFNSACGNYPHPLGTPITVAKRETPNGVDYMYQVKGQGPDGGEFEGTIFVSASKEEGASPELIKVVR